MPSSAFIGISRGFDVPNSMNLLAYFLFMTPLSQVLGPSGQAIWIEDFESGVSTAHVDGLRRRLAVQLAWMHRFPRQRTLCCGEPLAAGLP